MFGFLRKSPEWPKSTFEGRLRIRPMRRYDIEIVQRWFEDCEVLRLAFGTDLEEPQLKEMARIYLRDLDGHRHSILTVETPERRMVGFVRYHLSRQDGIRIARIGIVFGERHTWNQGYGSEAMRFLIDYLFAEKSVERIQLDTATFNKRAQRCFEKCGFVRTDGPPPHWTGHETTAKVWMELARQQAIGRR